MFGYSSVEKPLWNELQLQLDDLRNVYWPTDGKELADVGMLVGETFLRCIGLIRERINKELEGVEPLWLITGCFLLFFVLWSLKRLFSYNRLPDKLTCLFECPPTESSAVSRPCLNTQCSLCRLLETTCVIPKTGNGLVQGVFNCRSSNIVYLVHCKLCHQQYVGETGAQLVQRFSAHLKSVRQQKGALGEHFASPGHDWRSHLRIIVIQGNFWWTPARKRAEREWIKRLNTVHPSGMNRNRGTTLRISLFNLFR